MINIIHKSPDNVAAFKAKGKVTKADFDIVFERVNDVIDKYGQLNYLLNLKTDVSNFTSGAWLSDMFLGIKHLTKWNRCAIISDSKSIDQLTKLMDKFTIGEFRVFKHENLSEAMVWTSTGILKKTHRGSVFPALAAGIGGAIALNVLHESVRKNFNDVPEVNEVGEEALDKILKKADISLNEHQLYGATLVADVVSNGLFYALLATNKAGVASGLVAGIAAVELPKYLGLNEHPVAGSDRKKLLTVAYYTVGAAVAGFLYKKFKNR